MQRTVSKFIEDVSAARKPVVIEDVARLIVRSRPLGQQERDQLITVLDEVGVRPDGVTGTRAVKSAQDAARYWGLEA